MSAPLENKNAAKPAAEKRQAPAIYIRPTDAERKPGSKSRRIRDAKKSIISACTFNTKV
jgi:hypothetical protein